MRFHTLEILLSAVIKLAAIAALGPTAIAVIIFEVLLNAISMFNHSNIALPLHLDRLLRLLVVTPDMHRVHHSILHHETDSNFGFNFPWWDRLLGTYRPQPEAGHEGMTIGLPTLRNEHETERLPAMLWLPFRSTEGPEW
ncbi:MAG: sterol desaturase family protein [Planctomycetaceae bacterium]